MSKTQALNAVAAVAAAGVVCVALWAYTTTAGELPTPTTAVDVVPSAPISYEAAPVHGTATAPVVVIEYSDFECPYCGKFATDTLPSIKRSLVETGRVQIAFKHFPLSAIHPQAELAARVAVCANRVGRFWPLHDAMFSRQERLTPSDIESLAASLGIAGRSVSDCLATDAGAQVAADVAEAKLLKIRSVPTFFFGYKHSERSVAVVGRVSGGITATIFERQVRRVETVLSAKANSEAKGGG